MKLIAITAEQYFQGEAQAIELILASGMDFVHIRKPGSNPCSMAELIRQIPEYLHPRLKLHDNFELLKQFNLGGIHLNSRNSTPPKTSPAISKSCHTLEEVRAASRYDYVTLSPVFDSISKKGYRAKFASEQLRQACANARVVALGGVTPNHFDLLESLGFYGAAMLGWLWRGCEDSVSFESELRSRLECINKKLNTK